MRKKSLAVAAGGAIAGIVISLQAHSQPAASAPNTPQSFSPSFGDLMNMLVQPRHAKLGLAGQAGNWTLAAYAAHELDEALESVARARPRFANNSVTDLMKATVDGPIDALEKAAKAGDRKGFNDAYARLTEGCNSCHAALNHPFIVVKVPDQSSFANQEFRVSQ